MRLELFDIKLSSTSVLYKTGEKKSLRHKFEYNYLKIARLFHGPFRLASIVSLHLLYILT